MKKTIKLPGRYTILHSLGEGGTGHVYKVSDSVLDKTLALKILSDTDSKAHKTLEKEFEILSRLDHPNLVKVHDFGFTADNTPYLTMDFIEGDNLRVFLNDNINNIIPVLISIFSALNYLHTKNVIHADIKPENIMVTSSDNNTRTTLMDFGLAIIGNSNQKEISGTVHYLSPEILTDSIYSNKSDFYALGITIISCLTNIHIPIAHKITDKFYKNAYSLLKEVFNDAGINSPSSLASFIISLSSFDSDQRPESAEDCTQFLSRLYNITNNLMPVVQRNIFVGRKDEIAAVNNFLDSSNISINTLLILGETGIGKKSLIQQAIKIAQLKHFTTIDTSDINFKYDSFNKFINALGTHLPSISEDNLKKKHNDILESFTSNDSPGIPSKEQDITPVIYDNIIQFLNELSLDQRILICFPDIMSFSTDFIRFISHLIYETNMLHSNVKILISRNTDINNGKFKLELFRVICNMDNILQVHLNPFTTVDLSSLLVEEFGNILFSINELNILIYKSNGIPLYINNILGYMLKTSAIYQVNNNYFLDRKLLNNFNIPISLKDILKHTLSSIPVNQRNILQLIAIWKSKITISDLSFFLSKQQTEIFSDISILLGLNIISVENDTIIFNNPSYRSQIIKTISYNKRIRLNRDIAVFLSANNSIDYHIIANHFIDSNDLNNSIKYGLLSVDTLVSNHEYFNAYDLLNNIYKLSQKNGTIDNAIIILSHLVTIELKIGLIMDSIEHYDFLIKHTSSTNNKALYLKELGRIKHYYFLDKESAYTHYSDAKHIAIKCNDTDLLIEIMILQGLCKQDNNLNILLEAADLAINKNLNLYVYSLSQILYKYKLAGNIKEMVKTKNKLLHVISNPNITISNRRLSIYMLALASFYQGDYEQVKLYLTEMMEISNITCNEVENVSNLSMLGSIYYINGNFHLLISTLNKALAITKRLNMHSFMIIILSNLSTAYHILGDYRSALDFNNRAKSMMEQYSNYDLINVFKQLRFIITFGDFYKTELRHYSNKLRRQALKNNNSIILGLRSLALSRYYYQLLSHTKALKYALKALDYFRKTADKDDIVDTLSHMCIYELENNNTEQAASYIKEAREIFDAIHCDYLKPYLLLAEGSLSRVTHNSAAELILKEAYKASSKMGTRENTWQIQRQLALYYIDSGSYNNAVEMFREAIETIKQITESIPEEDMKLSYLSLPFRKRIFDEIKSLKSSNK
ncbi:MAG: protein kinase [Candidatus Krumholzibacteriota bacterium]|nr:protein kinase [Candidatus Krumholzibacteriota bacterium]